MEQDLFNVLVDIHNQLKRAQDWRERPSVRDRCVVITRPGCGWVAIPGVLITDFDLDSIEIGSGFKTRNDALEYYDRQFAVEDEGRAE